MPELVVQPPKYCQYASGPCDQSFSEVTPTDAYFFYSSTPAFVASTIERAAGLLRDQDQSLTVKTWKDMPINGQMIFCEICKAQRFTKVAIVDVTTMNFNLLFELGYALGLGIPVIPIRDTTYTLDKAEFESLGLIDTLGFLDFQNADELAAKLPAAIKAAKFPINATYLLNREQPLFHVRSPIVTDGLMLLMSALKKSGLRFRTFDPIEQPRLSLQDAFRQVKTSVGVSIYLLAADRRGATVHNARAAFVAGLAMASELSVFVLQEGYQQQPIDYRDVVQYYTNGAQIQHLVTPFIKGLYETIQSVRFVPITLPLRALETLDFGDVAAENEINALRSYFIPTAQYNDAKRGHARLIVGRKGAGKTAIFYGMRNAFWLSASHVVLDLKPEGHQFLTLREQLLKGLTDGMQEHLLTALWNYLILIELAAKIIDTDGAHANKDPSRFALYDKLVQILGPEVDAEEGDFSERLLTLVHRLLSRSKEMNELSSPSDITRLVYEKDIRELQQTLSAYLRYKDGVWILIDNLDKSWPVNRASKDDILIIKCLMEATRKLQRQLDRDHVECKAVVFIRNDIYEHLLSETADKGKDTAITLDWTDLEVFRQLIHRRMMSSTKVERPFDEMWPMFFEAYIRGEHSFSYILNRTMLRPRDLISFLKQCVSVAVNRGNNKVLEADILQAEKEYSEDQLQGIYDELRDVNSEFADVPYAFIESPVLMSKTTIENRMTEMGVDPTRVGEVLQLLLWFGFFGIRTRDGEERYAHMYQYGVGRMLREAGPQTSFVIHPAFRSVLQCN